MSPLPRPKLHLYLHLQIQSLIPFILKHTFLQLCHHHHHHHHHHPHHHHHHEPHHYIIIIIIMIILILILISSSSYFPHHHYHQFLSLYWPSSLSISRLFETLQYPPCANLQDMAYVVPTRHGIGRYEMRSRSRGTILCRTKSEKISHNDVLLRFFSVG